MLHVTVSSARLSGFGLDVPVALGKGGAVPASDKREGDGATPLGVWKLAGLLLRPDRVCPVATRLPWRWLRPTDGWSDDPSDPDYNRPVTHPHSRSAERLWRDDGVYDMIIVLDYNSAPVVPGRGSAIFWHLAQPDWRPTEGCVAIARDAMEALLPKLAPGMALRIDRG